MRSTNILQRSALISFNIGQAPRCKQTGLRWLLQYTNVMAASITEHQDIVKANDYSISWNLMEGPPSTGPLSHPDTTRQAQSPVIREANPLKSNMGCTGIGHQGYRANRRVFAMRSRLGLQLRHGRSGLRTTMGSTESPLRWSAREPNGQTGFMSNKV